MNIEWRGKLNSSPDAEPETTGKKDTPSLAEGRLMVVTFLSLALATIFTIIGAGLESELATLALIYSGAGFALLLPLAWISHDEKWSENYQLTRVMRFTPLFGIFFAAFGFFTLIESHRAGVGWFMGVACFVTSFMVVEASDRAKGRYDKANRRPMPRWARVALLIIAITFATIQTYWSERKDTVEPALPTTMSNVR
ncbi:MAG TPA: hypothetical protein VGB55_14830 [Tepidisphaeraceae bacterium]|jgi:apolipoprotein N-acyltransferase